MYTEKGKYVMRFKVHSRILVYSILRKIWGDICRSADTLPCNIIGMKPGLRVKSG